MLNQLLESKATKQKSAGSTIFSVVFHSLLIGGAVWATANAALPNEIANAENVRYITIKSKDALPSPKAMRLPSAPKNAVVAVLAPQSAQMLTVPIDVPTVIPDIDFSKQVPSDVDFGGKGVRGGSPQGVVGGTGTGTGLGGGDNGVYSVIQVEKRAMRDPNSPRPNYPEALRSAGIEGNVSVQFIVDTTGRAELSSLKILRSSHVQFTAEVQRSLGRIRFYPAEIGGRKVRQFVEMPFTFSLSR